MSAREQRAKQRELNKTEEQDDKENAPTSTSEDAEEAQLSKPKLDATSSDDGTSGSDSDDEPPPLLDPDKDFAANLAKRMNKLTALVTNFSSQMENDRKALAAMKCEFTEKLAKTKSTFKKELEGHQTNFTELFVAQDTKVNAVATDVVKLSTH